MSNPNDITVECAEMFGRALARMVYDYDSAHNAIQTHDVDCVYAEESGIYAAICEELRVGERNENRAAYNAMFEEMYAEYRRLSGQPALPKHPDGPIRLHANTGEPLGGLRCD